MYCNNSDGFITYFNIVHYKKFIKTCFLPPFVLLLDAYHQCNYLDKWQKIEHITSPSLVFSQTKKRTPNFNTLLRVLISYLCYKLFGLLWFANIKMAITCFKAVELVG